MRQRKITYVGWVGHNNLGDEALYEVNKHIFKPYQLVPDNTKHHSKITLFGGGTLLPDWTWEVISNRYNYAYGVGVRCPSFWGDYHPIRIKQMKRFNFRYIGVRGNNSKKLLSAWGINSTVIGDPCLLLEPTHYERKEDSRIAINIGGSRGLIWGRNEEQVFIEMAKVCKLLREKGFHPVLIPFWEDDLPHIKMVSRVTNTEIFNDWVDVQKTLDFIASCHVLIGEKLHSTVFSAAAQIPFISIEYRPKCRDFAETMGFEDYNIRTDRLMAEKVIAMFNNLSDNYTEMEKQLIQNVKKYRKKLRKFADCILKDIETLPENKWAPSKIEKIKWFLNSYRRRYEYKISKLKTFTIVKDQKSV